MSLYTDQRDEIKAQVQAVAGIGKVYTQRPNTTDEAKFNSDYVSSNKVNATFIVRSDGTDSSKSGVGTEDETDEILVTDKRDFWTITLLYGYNDAQNSEDTFQCIIDSMENKFRFLQDLNGKAFNSFPLQRTVSGVFVFFSDILCHKAEWRLQIVSRIINP